MVKGANLCSNTKAHLFVIWMAFNWLYTVRIRAKVVHRGNGRTYEVVNGVTRPRRDVVDSFNGLRYRVHERDFRLSLNPLDRIRSFLNGYRFYKSSWYSLRPSGAKRCIPNSE